jgi:hypothetical protein
MSGTKDNQIARLLEAGYSVDFASEDGVTKGWTRGDVLRVASERGWELDNSGRIPRPQRLAPRPPATQRPGRVLPEAPARPTPPRPTPPPVQPPPTRIEGTTVDPTKDKVATGLRSEHAPIRKAAEKANQALATLDTLLAEWESQQAARERVAELEQALAEAKAALRKKKPAAASKPGEHKQARAWAREQGIHVPDIGRVPTDVLEQWREAGAA